MTTDLQDHFAGCLLGCAIGDAVGAPVEARDFEHCQKYVRNYVRPQHLEHIQRPAIHEEPAYRFGQITDDTQLTVLLAITIMNTGRADPEHFAKLLVRAFDNGIVVGSGRATRQAVQALSQGVPWSEAGAPAPMAGNGTAMRAAPLGMLHYQDPEALSQAAYQTSIVTHQDPICTAGTIAISLAVAMALQGQNPEEERWAHQMDNWVRPYSLRMADEILDVWENRKRDPETMSERISKHNIDTGGRVWDRISPYVLPSVLWSLYSYLHTPEDFWETICTAICPGGDVDTTGAMAGAISGAHNGTPGMPPKIIAALQDRGTFLAPILHTLASSIWDLIHE